MRDKKIVVRSWQRLEAGIMIMEVCRVICLNWTEIEWWVQLHDFSFSLELFWGLRVCARFSRTKLEIVNWDRQKNNVNSRHITFFRLCLNRTKSWMKCTMNFEGTIEKNSWIKCVSELLMIMCDEVLSAILTTWNVLSLIGNG